MTHLIITSANFPKEECAKRLGYPFELRAADYLSSIHHALRFRQHFDSMTVLETVARERIEYLETCGIPVSYSNVSNDFSNKGVNEVRHLWNFISQEKFKEDDIFVKLTGRYLLVDVQILNHLANDTDIVAKNDGDIYHPSSRGVHTFLWAFRKRFLRQFITTLDLESEDPIEWHVKAFARRRSNARILEKDSRLGVITCLFSPENGLWKRVLC